MSRLIKRSKHIFYLIGQSLGGEDHSFTKGSIKTALIILSVPMIIEMVFESLFAVVDIYFVSKVGTAAVASVGLTESVMTLVYSLAFGVSMAATAMVSRRTGEGDHTGAAKGAAQSLIIALLLSVTLAIVGLSYSNEILTLMGAEPALAEYGSIYLSWMFGGNITIVFLFVINGIFRGVGKPRIAMFSLFVSNGLNIILDPCLILGLGFFPELGLKGAAIATTIGRGLGVAFQLFHLFKGHHSLKFSSDMFIPDLTILRRLLKIAAGGVGQMLISSAAWIFLARIVAEYGEAAFAGYTISIRVIIFAILPAWGLSNAAATLVGQNLGAGEPERAEKSVWMATKANLVFLGILALSFGIFAEEVISIFDDTPDVLAVAIPCLQIICLGYVPFGLAMVLSQSFNGAGDTRTPTLINFICEWVFQIPVAYLMAKTFGLGPYGVFLTVALTSVVMATLFFIRFRQGNWKTQKV
ncbi:MATE family efflux transporter [Marinigracilibium pacificum]|uniref:Multidrug-efflux transporter n=1 Tax=Marinigracilibium pacificum TaxID=2729599 RepID=A0A848IX49_9BACT|nr:MATE family efflux transporter [Marinigracilibium pacificum]NMM46830.1 MATE family efflux transporter [Marinigracilibium pacificum]